MAEDTAELTMDQELEALLNPSTPAAPAAADALGSKPDAATKDPAVASPPGSETEDPLLKALDEIEEDKPEVAPEAPKLSDEQQQILRAVPDVQTATRLYQAVENYTNFTNAFQGGKYDDVQSMFEAWDASAFEGFLEHIYAKKVESGEWVDRFIAEKEGRGTEHKGLGKLEREVRALKARLEQQGKPNVEAEQQRQLQQSFTDYKAHVEGLFDKLDFSKTDRKWVTADLNARVAADPKLLTAIRSGNPKAVNGLFKVALKEYVNRDKEVSTETAAKVEVQSQKRMPLGSSASDVAPEIPEDINQVKPEDREKWQDKMLGKLFGKKK